MATIHKLKCTICDTVYQPDEVQYTCPACGEVGTVDVLYDYDTLKTQLNRADLASNTHYSMWRYRALLPLKTDSQVSPLRVGFTPLYDSPRLAQDLGVVQAWVKDDGQNPTGSLKDRASAMVVARAMEQGIDIVTTASTGNAAAALAGIGASVGMKTIIFVPASAPESKIAQLLVYGANVLLIEDSYDTAFDLCLTTSIEQGWYCRNTGINPFTTEGKKTAAFEIAEQCQWEMPDVVVTSVGDGSIIGGLHKGFYDLYQIGWVERIPRLIGVQAIGSSPLVQAWQNKQSASEMTAVQASSIADSIVAGLPRDRAKALRAVRETQGAFLSVTDAEILQAIPQYAQLTGVFAEPASSASFAGAKRAVQLGLIKTSDRVVLLNTGNGLKDIGHARESVGKGQRVAPDMQSVKQALDI